MNERNKSDVGRSVYFKGISFMRLQFTEHCEKGREKKKRKGKTLSTKEDWLIRLLQKDDTKISVGRWAHHRCTRIRRSRTGYFQRSKYRCTRSFEGQRENVNRNRPITFFLLTVEKKCLILTRLSGSGIVSLRGK